MKVSRRGSVDRYYLIKLWGYAIFLHRIHTSDPPDVYHDHPWSWFSLIFGSYLEEKPGQPSRVRRFWNYLRAAQPHRVRITKPTWTILFHGKRRCEWKVYDANGRVTDIQPWRGVENPDRKSYRK